MLHPTGLLGGRYLDFVEVCPSGHTQIQIPQTILSFPQVVTKVSSPHPLIQEYPQAPCALLCGNGLAAASTISASGDGRTWMTNLPRPKASKQDSFVHLPSQSHVGKFAGNRFFVLGTRDPVRTSPVCQSVSQIHLKLPVQWNPRTTVSTNRHAAHHSASPKCHQQHVGLRD